MNAQNMQILLLQPNNTSTTPSDLWNMTIYNSGAEMSVELQVDLRDSSNQLLVSYLSNMLTLKSGVNTIRKDQTQITNSDYKNHDLQRMVVATGFLPEGNYNLCVTVRYVQNNEIQGTSCRMLRTQAAVLNNRSKNENQIVKNIDTYGNISVEALASKQAAFNQTLPSNYLRLDANPAVTLYNIPVLANVHLTTESSADYPNLNTYSLSFDRNMFQQRLQDMLINKLISANEKQTILDSKVLAQLQELDNIESVLNDKALELELQLKDSINTALQALQADTSLSVADKKERLESLQNKYNALIAKEQQVERLIERKDELLALKEKWESTGLLDEISNRKPTIPDFNDPDVLRSTLKEYGLYVGANKWFSGVRHLTIGTCYPIFSPLTLQGIQTNGGYLQLDKGNFFMGAVAGEASAFVTDSLDIFNGTKRMAGIRLGTGSEMKSHFFVGGVVFRDHNFTSGEQQLFPQQSNVANIDFQIGDSHSGWFELGSEIAGLLYNHNLNDTSNLASVLSNDIKLPDAIKVSPSNSIDFAWNGRVILNIHKSGTSLTGSGTLVGPGYQNPGTPMLRTDIRGIQANLEQNLFDSKIICSMSYRNELDNISGGKGIPTNLQLYKVEITAKPKLLPQMLISYIHNDQENAFLNYGSDIALMALNYSCTPGTLISGTTIHYMKYLQAYDSLTATPFTSDYIMLNQMLTFGNGMSAVCNVQYSTNQSDSEQSNNLVTSLQGNARIGKRLQLSLSASYADATQIEQRFGGTAYAQYLLSSHYLMSFSAAMNQFSNLPDSTQPFTDAYARLGLQVNW
jgi:hypothetical protein